ADEILLLDIGVAQRQLESSKPMAVNADTSSEEEAGRNGKHAAAFARVRARRFASPPTLSMDHRGARAAELAGRNHRQSDDKGVTAEGRRDPAITGDRVPPKRAAKARPRSHESPPTTETRAKAHRPRSRLR